MLPIATLLYKEDEILREVQYETSMHWNTEAFAIYVQLSSRDHVSVSAKRLDIAFCE
jgi:hypothetical protein